MVKTNINSDLNKKLTLSVEFMSNNSKFQDKKRESSSIKINDLINMFEINK